LNKLHSNSSGDTTASAAVAVCTGAPVLQAQGMELQLQHSWLTICMFFGPATHLLSASG
jgi:hypothetical protein